jgi:hypothetical protein
MKSLRFGDYLAVTFDDRCDLRLASPQEPAEIWGTAGEPPAARGACECASSLLPEFVILLDPGLCPETHRIAWFQPIGAPVRIQGEKLPLQLLVSSQLNADGRDRHRILAAIYDLNAKTAATGGIDPPARHDAQFHSGAIKIAPQVDKAEQCAEERDAEGNTIHASDPAAGAADRQPEI